MELSTTIAEIYYTQDPSTKEMIVNPDIIHAYNEKTANDEYKYPKFREEIDNYIDR